MLIAAEGPQSTEPPNNDTHVVTSWSDADRLNSKSPTLSFSLCLSLMEGCNFQSQKNNSHHQKLRRRTVTSHSHPSLNSHKKLAREIIGRRQLSVSCSNRVIQHAACNLVLEPTRSWLGRLMARQTPDSVYKLKDSETTAHTTSATSHSELATNSQHF